VKYEVTQRIVMIEASAESRVRESEDAMHRTIVDIEGRHHILEQRYCGRATEAAYAEAVVTARYQQSAEARERRIVDLEKLAANRDEEMREYFLEAVKASEGRVVDLEELAEERV